MLRIKRIYDKPHKSDGLRVLIDRLWPRGVSKERADIDRWMKEISPSDCLRKRFGHKAEYWQEFKKCYLQELENKKHLAEELKKMAKKGTVTLLYAAKNATQNNAVVLLEFINEQ